MNWENLLSTQRYASASNKQDIRTAFQRDYDRIIFSSAFRRLQNKTQVFPLPKNIIVHNRLTHSIEVSSVGRSIARLVARELSNKYNSEFQQTINEIDTVVSAACLAHDLGNPPFGHSGEKAIGSYFEYGEGQKLKEKIAPEQWSDFVNFEGNANAFRLLTHQFEGRRQGGYSLTAATLASLIKYPYPSFGNENMKKYGVFHSEIEAFRHITTECNIPCIDSKKNIFARHPLSFIVEAADDICYLILDMEDAHKLGIVSTNEIETVFLSFFNPETEIDFFEYKENTYANVIDKNERMAFLRATVINKLVECVAKTFLENYEAIMKGSFSSSLIENIGEWEKQAVEKCRKDSKHKIYNHPSVIKIELSGFKVLGTLLHEFCEAVMQPEKTYNKKLLSLLPNQFNVRTNEMGAKIQSVIDFISNMTDVYAMQLYKDLRGI
ncbi:MAG: deoxyguanosinetriphosphate triphosphohydrolase [Lentimicrobiaceae bacterium]|jgi:dGTPase|nr:deoxyguanosinetriphosphate triphosphohydrolase [Lentimicrobiaceae bacterium]